MSEARPLDGENALITGEGASWPRTSKSCSQTARSFALPAARTRHHRRRRGGGRVRGRPAGGGLQLRRLSQRRGVRARRGSLLRGQRPGGQAPRGALRRRRSHPRAREHQLRLRRRSPGALHGQDAPSPRSIYALSKLAGEYAALAYCPDALVVRSGGLRTPRKRVQGRELRAAHARARPRAGKLKMVADQRLTPTFTADLAGSLVEAGRDGRPRTASRDQRRLVLLARVHRRDHGHRRRGRPGRGRDHHPAARWCRPPTERRVVHRAGPRRGSRSAQPWREALEDYMLSAGLAAEPSAR